MKTTSYLLAPKKFSVFQEKIGFTLSELLIVVLIIGVLATLALPQYQKAVENSRYATLMPMAKTIHDAQESYLMANGHYSRDLSELHAQIPGNPSGSSASLPDGLTAQIGNSNDYEYIKMSKTGLNNNYIMYQTFSENYPGEIHCEALAENVRAKGLCESLGGREISGSITEGYITYVLNGQGNGVAVPQNGGEGGSGEGSGSEGGSSGSSVDTRPMSACTIYGRYSDCVQYQNADGTSEEVYSCKQYGKDTTCHSLSDANGNQTTWYHDGYTISDSTIYDLGHGNEQYHLISNSNGIVDSVTIQGLSGTDPVTGENTRMDVYSTNNNEYSINYGEMGGGSQWNYNADGTVKSVVQLGSTSWDASGEHITLGFRNNYDSSGNLMSSTIIDASGNAVYGNPYNEWDDGEAYWNWENQYQDAQSRASSVSATSGQTTRQMLDYYTTQYCALNPSNAALCS